MIKVGKRRGGGEVGTKDKETPRERELKRYSKKSQWWQHGMKKEKKKLHVLAQAHQSTSLQLTMRFLTNYHSQRDALYRYRAGHEQNHLTFRSKEAFHGAVKMI